MDIANYKELPEDLRDLIDDVVNPQSLEKFVSQFIDKTSKPDKKLDIE